MDYLSESQMDSDDEESAQSEVKKGEPLLINYKQLHTPIHVYTCIIVAVMFDVCEVEW